MSSMTRELMDGRASLSLAENLSAQYCTDAVGNYLVRRTANGRLKSAWAHVEYALNHEVEMDDFERNESLDCARSLTRMILDKTSAHMDTHFEALILACYLPVFKKRAYGIDITADDCANVYESLCNAFAYIKPLEVGEMPSTLSLEAFVLALSARTRRPDYLMYPTSPREESSEQQSVNHDSYFIKYQTKLPIQQKLIPTEHEYNHPITMLTLMPLVSKANRKCGYVVEDEPADQLNNPIALVVAEVMGEQLEKHEKTLLDTMSEGVVAYYRRAAIGLGGAIAA